MENIFSGLTKLACLTLILFLSHLPLTSYASEKFYTIQLGSFIEFNLAQKQFDSLTEKLKEDDLDHLRIEQIDEFYVVRAGKFESKTPAEKLLRKVNPLSPGAIIMRTYIRDERIIRIYKRGSLTEAHEAEEGTSKPAGPDKDVTEKVGKVYPPKIETDGRAESVGELIAGIADLVDKKDYEGAVDMIKAGLERWPDSPDLYGWYGSSLLKMNLPDKALKHFRKAAELAPEEPNYHNGVGYALLYVSRANESVDEFNRAINLAPGHIDALAGLGLAYVNLNQKDLALGVYSRLKDVDRDAANTLFEIIMRR